MVNVSHEEGVLEIEEREIINNVFQFGDMQAKEAMIQRLDIVAINSEDTYEEIMDLFKNEKLSRLPVYEESIDNIIGILNIKDVVFLEDEEIENFNIKEYVREAFFTYEFKKITQLLEEMKKEKCQMAIVVDEYGATAGLITVEDLVEVIVGDIDDEYDEVNDSIVKINDHEYLVDGSLNLNEVNDEIDTHFESEDFESIGGLVLGEFSGVPKIKDKIEFPGVTIIIEKMHKNRIELLRLIIHEMKEEEEGEEKHQ